MILAHGQKYFQMNFCMKLQLNFLEEEEEEYLMNSIEAPANVCTPFEYK